MRKTSTHTSRVFPVAMVSMATIAVFLILLGLSVRGLPSVRFDDGNVVLIDATMQLQGSQLQLSAKADIRLPTTLQAGLDNGVPLTFVLHLKLLKPAKFWFDASLHDFEKRYRLTYYELTRHYRVEQLDSDQSRNYRSLSSALAGLGNMSELMFDLPETVLEAAPQSSAENALAATQAKSQSASNSVANETDVEASLILSLDTSALPLPLQPLMKLNRDLSSEEYRWPVL